MLGWPPSPPVVTVWPKVVKERKALHIDNSRYQFQYWWNQWLAVAGFSAAEDKLTGWLLGRDPSTLIFYHFSSPARRAAASQSQLSRGDGGVTPWTSRQFITGPWETNNHLHSHSHTHTTNSHKVCLVCFWEDLFLYLTKCDNLMRTHCRTRLNIFNCRDRKKKT